MFQEEKRSYLQFLVLALKNTVWISDRRCIYRILHEVSYNIQFYDTSTSTRTCYKARLWRKRNKTPSGHVKFGITQKLRSEPSAFVLNGGTVKLYYTFYNIKKWLYYTANKQRHVIKRDTACTGIYMLNPSKTKQFTRRRGGSSAWAVLGWDSDRTNYDEDNKTS